MLILLLIVIEWEKDKTYVKGVMHRLAVTVFPETTQSYISLNYLEIERPIYQRVFDQLKNSSTDKIKFYLSMVLPLYSENMVLSPDLWNSWDEEVKTAYIFYANLKAPDAVVISKAISMGLRNVAKSMDSFAYSKRSKIDLFL